MGHVTEQMQSLGDLEANLQAEIEARGFVRVQPLDTATRTIAFVWSFQHLPMRQALLRLPGPAKRQSRRLRGIGAHVAERVSGGVLVVLRQSTGKL